MLSNMKRSEETEQIILMDWCNLNVCRYPELKLIYHVPNGGKRSKTEAIRFKRAGVKKGVPDLCLPVARDGSYGLYIEMKYGNGRTSKEQKEWIEELNNQGYKAIVCNGFEEAREVIEEYLKDEDTRTNETLNKMSNSELERIIKYGYELESFPRVELEKLKRKSRKILNERKNIINI